MSENIKTNKNFEMNNAVPELKIPDPLVNKRISAYINTLLEKNDNEKLGILREKAESLGVPIIRMDTESLLRVLLKIYRPQKILEIGTAIGYSAIVMGLSSDPTCIIKTIESDEARVIKASENIKEFELSEKIEVINGDAKNILPLLRKSKEKYDLIFIDAAKGQYKEIWEKTMDLLTSDSVIVCDNVLQEGSIIHSRFLIEQRDRTIHKRMRDFLYDITHDEGFETSILTVGDGMSISVRKK